VHSFECKDIIDACLDKYGDTIVIIFKCAHISNDIVVRKIKNYNYCNVIRMFP